MWRRLCMRFRESPLALAFTADMGTADTTAPPTMHTREEATMDIVAVATGNMATETIASIVVDQANQCKSTIVLIPLASK